MALDSGNVRVGVTGALHVAPLGTPLPTSPLSSLPAVWQELGYVSDGGITQSISVDTTDIQAWQNATTVRTLQTGHTVTYALELLEINWVTLDTYYGNFSGGVSELNAGSTLRKSWVFDIIDGSENIRIVVPEGQITERGDTVFVSGDAVKLPITITAYDDDDGVKAYVYNTVAGS